MKKILIFIIGIPLAIGLLYGASFIFEIILNLFLIKEIASAILPSWLTYVFDIVAVILTILVFGFKQNEKRFEVITAFMLLILVVTASHIARYSWLYLAIACLTLACVILKLIRNIIGSQSIQKES